MERTTYFFKKLLYALLIQVSLLLSSCDTESITEKSDEIKVLNNFVTQLFKVTSVSRHDVEFNFSNPCEGWIFISSTANVVGSGKVSLAIDSDSVENAVIVHEAGKERTLEAMRLLSAGDHKVGVWCENGSSLDSMIIRAIPEIFYSSFGYESAISGYRPYDWKFLEKHVLKNVNTLVTGAWPSEEQLPDTYSTHIEPWKRQGKRVIGECALPGLRDASEAPGAYNYWTGIFDKLSYLDGVLVDEFWDTEKIKEQYEPWIDAVKRICDNEKYKDKMYIAYVTGNYYSKDFQKEFAQILMDRGYRMAWEKYISEEAKSSFQEAGRELLEKVLVKPMQAWRKIQPDIAKHMIMTFCYHNTPVSNMNINPRVNYNVWMDMQVNMVANDPVFSGINGINWWTSAYGDEEIIRWCSKLVRHYCIEGKTEMLSTDPYRLTHIVNPDFEEGTEEWTIKPAEEGNIEVKNYNGYGKIYRRDRSWAPSKGEGDTFLWMKRSSKAPNVFSQEIKKLEPGRLYSMKMITSDYRDLIKKKGDHKKHAVNIEIVGAKVDMGKSFQHDFTDRLIENKSMMNYYWLVFRAKGNTARLIISDWANGKTPGGPIGQELIYNFIEVQPYIED